MVQDILLIDDSRTELLHLSKLLTRHGYQVRSALDAEQALQALAEQVPDLILMDVVMPGTNGFALTRQLGRDPRYAHVPVFICSSKNQESDRVWGLRQGARAYFTKPVDAAALIAGIDALDAPVRSGP